MSVNVPRAKNSKLQTLTRFSAQLPQKQQLHSKKLFSSRKPINQKVEKFFDQTDTFQLFYHS